MKFFHKIIIFLAMILLSYQGHAQVTGGVQSSIIPMTSGGVVLTSSDLPSPQNSIIPMTSGGVVLTSSDLPSPQNSIIPMTSGGVVLTSSDLPSPQNSIIPMTSGGVVLTSSDLPSPQNSIIPMTSGGVVLTSSDLPSPQNSIIPMTSGGVVLTSSDLPSPQNSIRPMTSGGVVLTSSDLPNVVLNTTVNTNLAEKIITEPVTEFSELDDINDIQNQNVTVPTRTNIVDEIVSPATLSNVVMNRLSTASDMPAVRDIRTSGASNGTGVSEPLSLLVLLGAVSMFIIIRRKANVN